MKRVITAALSGALFLLVMAVLGIAQEAPRPTEPQTEQLEEPEQEYTVKAYTLAVFGGRFSGGTFLDLQALEDRTQLAEGANDVTRYDGTLFTPQELANYDAPRKEIESGQLFGGRIGIYLSEKLHLDLVVTYSSSRAVTSFLNVDPDDPRSPFREEKDEDPGFTMYSGGMNLMYDPPNFSIYGFRPYLGFGIGGLINRFSELEDKTALYFQGVGGLNYPLGGNMQIFIQGTATTFTFETEELQYGDQVTYTSFGLGISYWIDTVPEAILVGEETD